MKKLSKKLKLNKETISALNNEQMSNVKGGATIGCNGEVSGQTNCLLTGPFDNDCPLYTAAAVCQTNQWNPNC